MNDRDHHVVDVDTGEPVSDKKTLPEAVCCAAAMNRLQNGRRFAACKVGSKRFPMDGVAEAVMCMMRNGLWLDVRLVVCGISFDLAVRDVIVEHAEDHVPQRVLLKFADGGEIVLPPSRRPGREWL